jgi:hypothetical protein
MATDQVEVEHHCLLAAEGVLLTMRSREPEISDIEPVPLRDTSPSWALPGIDEPIVPSRASMNWRKYIMRFLKFSRQLGKLAEEIAHRHQRSRSGRHRPVQGLRQARMGQR